VRQPQSAIRNPQSAIRSGAWIAVFALAAALRLAHVIALVRQPVFWDANLQGGSDMSGFIAWAARLAAEGGFWDGRGIYTYSAPLFPFLLAGFFHLAGPDLAWAAAAQALVSAGTCLIIGWAAYHLFGERRIALVAATLAALYGPFVFYTTKLHAATAEVAAVAVAFGGIAWALRGLAPGRWFAVGVPIGVAALGRPNFFVVAGGAAAGLLLRRGAAGRVRVAAAAAVVLAASLVVGAASLRTVALGGPLVPLTQQLGPVWRLANSYDSQVLNFRMPRENVMPVLSPAFWTHQARKAAVFWWGYEVPQNMNMYFIREFSPVLQLPLLAFWFIFPLACLGLWWARDRWGEFLPLLLGMLAYYLSTVLFFIAARYRIPLVPALLAFAAFAVVRLWDRWRAGGWRAVWVPAAVCLALVVAGKPHRERLIHSTEYAYLARDAADRGDGLRAQWALERGVRLFPHALGDRAGAATRLLRDVRREAGVRPLPEARRHLYLGLATLLTEGPPRQAAQYLRLAAGGFPQDPAAADLRHMLATFAPGGNPNRGETVTR
jgi:4-amino-4-deoxy-L-arabinose transferase-like glycosyltransferase